MTENGVSKKVFVVTLSITAIAQMAANTQEKMPYAIVIGVIAVVYWAVQGYIDWSKDGKKE